jgi:hypothetical protein
MAHLWRAILAAAIDTAFVKAMLNLNIALESIPRDVANAVRFGLAAPRKHQTIYVDPRRVVHCVKDPARFNDTSFSGQVLDGDWDQPGVLCAETVVARWVRARINGATWREAGAYDGMLKAISERGRIDGCSNLDDIVARYERLDELIRWLKSGNEFLRENKVRKRYFRECAGVLVHVGRNGELLHGAKGNHRLAIAREIGLRWIPAQVGVVHRKAVESGAFRALTRRPDYPQFTAQSRQTYFTIPASR